MRDPRLEKLAQVLVHYSLEVKKGDKVLLNSELGGLALVEALYRELIRAGALVKTNLIISALDEIFMKEASEEQLSWTSPFAMHEVSIADKRIRIIAPDNTRAMSQVDPKRQAIHSKASAPIMSLFMERSAKGELKWQVTLAPTQASAQEAEMGFFDYEDFVFRAGYLDESDPIATLRRLELAQDRLIDFLKNKRELHFKTGQGTDLRVNVEGMRWLNACGKRNFPDGEVFTGPNLKASDGGINGVVHFTYPAIWHGTVVENVKLTFEKGRVVNARASKNESFLKTILAQDPGASTLGEIAIGTNYRIKKFTQNILFDEKIGGTFHAALGAGYPETGNSNQSALHWDMICDLREGGTIHADGELLSSSGKFQIPDTDFVY